MKSMSKALLALSLTALALGGSVTASASAALPEFKTSANIKGKGGEVLFEQKGFGAWKCTSTSLKGSVTGGSKVAHATITFNGCDMTWLGSNLTCGNPPSGSSFTTEALTGTLGYVEKSAKTVGLELQASSGEYFAKFECERSSGAKTKVEMQGALIGALTPVDTATKSYELVLKKASPINPYEQAITKLEGGLEDPFTVIFGTAAAAQTGVNATEAIEAEKITEIGA